MRTYVASKTPLSNAHALLSDLGVKYIKSGMEESRFADLLRQLKWTLAKPAMKMRVISAGEERKAYSLIKRCIEAAGTALDQASRRSNHQGCTRQLLWMLQ